MNSLKIKTTKNRENQIIKWIIKSKTISNKLTIKKIKLLINHMRTKSKMIIKNTNLYNSLIKI